MRLPYGSWPSPITAATVAEGGVRLGTVTADGDTVYWLESRPIEGGRTAIVRRQSDGAIGDVVPAEFNARTLVHEYGGGQYLASAGSVYASNLADQRVHRVSATDAIPLTDEPARPMSDRYADFTPGPDGSLYAVEEHHDEEGDVINRLVRLDSTADGFAATSVAAGRDFYASPRWSPDRDRLAFLTWDHPSMPWDGTELFVTVADGSDPVHVAGGPQESVFQPEWGRDGRLHFVSDRSGWWNLYRQEDDGTVGRVGPPMETEFGVPQWLFGYRRYAFLPDGRIVAAHTSGGFDRLAVLGADGWRAVAPQLRVIASTMAIASGRVWTIAGSPAMPLAVVAVDPDTGSVEVVRSSATGPSLDEAYLPVPEAISFPTSGGANAHAFYYAPAHPEAVGLDGERPPVIVVSHGGPTSATTAGFRLATRYWTSRGIAVVDVNYRGSTGYGRSYRESLNGNWGVADVDDCIAAVRYLADRGDVDPDRAAIRGGSAGGYATLCALSFHDVFAAGASYFGVGDLEALARHTHKFESRYLDSMVGPYPEAADLYRERSPLHAADGISCPVILFQGLEDKVVPPSQAEDMVAALTANGVPHAYIAYEGEQHGFRMAENIVHSLESELSFYGQVFGFQPADGIASVELTPPLSGPNS